MSFKPPPLAVVVDSLCWDTACFEAIMASWKTRTAADGETLLVNPTVFHFITGCFLPCLCLGIRKLTDRGPLAKKESDKSDKSVYSLHSVITDIKEYREHFTRRRLFLACGLEYDVDGIRRKYDEFVRTNYPRGGVFALPRELNERPSEFSHVRWDSYCGRASIERMPDDLICSEYLDKLLVEVESINSNVVFLVNKRFAHAATPESRGSAKIPKESISLEELQGLLVRCGCMINSVSAILSSAVFEFVASAQFDKWESWGRGWEADPATLEAAWRAWEARVRRIEPMLPERIHG